MVIRQVFSFLGTKSRRSPNISPGYTLINLAFKPGRSLRITDRFVHDRRTHLRNNFFIHIARPRASHFIALLPVKL